MIPVPIWTVPAGSGVVPGDRRGAGAVVAAIDGCGEDPSDGAVVAAGGAPDGMAAGPVDVALGDGVAVGVRRDEAIDDGWTSPSACAVSAAPLLAVPVIVGLGAVRMRVTGTAALVRLALL
jgi:hypothetical protein